jgi:hypothetical protein
MPRVNNHGSSKSVLVAVMLALAVLVAILATVAGTEENYNDPRKGWVHIDHSVVSKTCDGTTLVYSGNNGVSTIPNSPECS